MNQSVLGKAFSRGRRRWALVVGGALGVTLLLGAFQVVKAHVLEPFRSPTSTMMPTLAPGDRFFVDKRQRPLRRGDVVVFRVPPNLSLGFDLRVKRAVAVAGDTVEMRAGQLVVNGAPVAAQRVGSLSVAGEVFEEWQESIDDRSYHVLRAPGGGPRATFGPITVPAGHFFMLGDNRDRNNDSRRYEAIPIDMIVGRAVWIWWSRAPAGGIRWDRVGRRL